MQNMFLQLVITVWVGGHPLTAALPHLYPATGYDKCQAKAAELFQHRKNPKQQMTIDCQWTPKRDA